MKKYKDVTKQYFEDATPGKGNIDYDKKFKNYKYKQEIANALIIHSVLGGDIFLINPNNQNGISCDYIRNYENRELKSPVTLKGIDKLIRKAIKQIGYCEGGIIINADLLNEPIEEIIRIAINRVKRYKSSDLVVDLIIIKDKKIIRIARI